MKDKLIEAGFSTPAPFANEATLTSDIAAGFHRLAFLEIDPNGDPHIIAAVTFNTAMLERLHEIFGQRLAKPGILKPQHYGAN